MTHSQRIMFRLGVSRLRTDLLTNVDGENDTETFLPGMRKLGLLKPVVVVQRSVGRGLLKETDGDQGSSRYRLLSTEPDGDGADLLTLTSKHEASATLQITLTSARLELSSGPVLRLSVAG